MKVFSPINSAADLLASPRFRQRANTYVRWYPKTLDPNFDDRIAIPAAALVDGLYMHIPFCEAICRFCPFNKVPSNAHLIARFVNGLCKELEIYSTHLDLRRVRFVYLGGGTPSVLNDEQLARIFNALKFSGVPLHTCEISMEAHPSHLRENTINAWHSLGINRLSTGIQAFRGEELMRLGSHHTANDVRDAMAALHAGKISNYAIDLLYRYEGQSLADWEYTLDQTIDFQVPHISAYALVEPSAPTFQARVVEAEMATLLDRKLFDAGYAHYASCASGGYDYCIGGAAGVYEQSHWGAPQASYLGLGPGAFGFVGGVTTVNGLGIDAYCEATKAGELPLASAYRATKRELRRRFFVLGVKTLNVSLLAYRHEFMEDVPTDIMKTIEELCQENLIEASSDEIILTPLGRHFVDEISAAFFSKEQATEVHPEEPEIRRAEIIRRRAKEKFR